MTHTDEQFSKWHLSRPVDERNSSGDQEFCVQFDPDRFALIASTIILGILLLAVAFWNHTIEQAKAQQIEHRRLATCCSVLVTSTEFVTKR